MFDLNDDLGKDCQIDPLTAIIIIEAIVKISQLLYECSNQDEDEAVKILGNPTRLQRIQLKWHILREFGFKDYVRNRKKYIRAFENQGKQVTSGGVKELWKENVEAFEG